MFQMSGEDPNVKSLKSITDELTDLGKNFGARLGDTMTNLIVKGYEINKIFGQTGERLVEIQQAAADAIPSITRLGGNIDTVGLIMSEVAKESLRNTIATTDQMEKLYATFRVTGVGVGTLTKNFLEAGYGLNKVGDEMESVVNYVRSIGGNVEQVTKSVVSNLDHVNRFSFEKGVVGFTKMAAQASILRFDMQNTLDFADRVMNPEGAIAMASAFQRLGVAAGSIGDPFSMLNQSITDPSGLQDSLINIGKQFVEFNKEAGKFQISREGVLRLREVEQEAGLMRGSLSKAGIAAAELDARLSQISPSIKFKNEEDKMLLANIGRMGDGGQYEVQIEPGGEYVKFNQLGQKQIDELIKKQADAPKTMEEIARAQMRFDETISADVKVIKNTLLYGAASQTGVLRETQRVGNVARNMGGEISGMASTQGTRRMFEKAGDVLLQLGKDILQGKGMTNADKYAKAYEGLGTEVKDFLKEAFGKAVEAGKKELKADELTFIKKFLEEQGFNYNDSLKTINDKLEQNKTQTQTQPTTIPYQMQPANTPKPLGIDFKPDEKVRTDYQKQNVPENFVRGDREMAQAVTNVNQENGNMTITQKVSIDPWTITVNAPAGVDKQYLSNVLNSNEFKAGFTEQIMKYMKVDKANQTMPPFAYQKMV